MNDLIVNILGWVGSVFIVGAYYLNSNGNITAQSKAYQSANFLGCLLLGINTLYFGAYPSAVVNMIWMGISVYYIIKLYNHGKQTY